MKLLALETSTERCSVALHLDGKVFVDEVHAGQKHSDMVMEMLAGICERNGITVQDIEGFAFGSGPGSFTGLRIACGVVQGMAFGLDRKVVGVPTLLAIAEQAAAPRVIAALDARMGETYFAAYERVGDAWHTVVEPCLCGTGTLPVLSGDDWVGIGSGFDAHDYVRSCYAGQLLATRTGCLPSAREVATLAVREFAAGHAVDAEHAMPLYVRDKVALTIEERALRKAHAAA